MHGPDQLPSRGVLASERLLNGSRRYDWNAKPDWQARLGAGHAGLQIHQRSREA
jgi:hypothetical protein